VLLYAKPVSWQPAWPDGTPLLLPDRLPVYSSQRLPEQKRELLPEQQLQAALVLWA
jgi:hypothetical protein